MATALGSMMTTAGTIARAQGVHADGDVQALVLMSFDTAGLYDAACLQLFRTADVIGQARLYV